jgi:hypothetical protein
MSTKNTAPYVCFVVLAAACQMSDSPPPIYSVEWGVRTVAPSVEGSKCIIKSLGNTVPVRVNSVDTVLGPTSHHMMIYRERDTVERTEPFECVSFINALDAHFAPMFIAQKLSDVLTLPPGVAFTIQPGELIRVELHYINTTDFDSTANAKVVFHAIDESEFEHEANFFFVGTPDVVVPARRDVSLGPVYFPLPPGFEDSKFFAITGHQHRMGTGVTVDVVQDKQSAGAAMYRPDDFQWDAPLTVYHDPPFSVPAGGGFRFTCQWNNTSDQVLRYGGSSLDEMCMFWTYYYPSQGTKVCFHTEVPLAFDACCPGAPGCGTVF